MVLMKIGGKLIVSIHVYLLLQLTSYILVSIIIAQVLVQLRVLGSLLGSSTLLLLLLSNGLLVLVLLISLIPLVVESDQQLVLLGSC